MDTSEKKETALSASERINFLLDALNVTTRKLALSIGLKRPDIIYNVINEVNNISPELAKKISEKYNISTYWLVYGEGPISDDVEWCEKLSEWESKLPQKRADQHYNLSESMKNLLLHYNIPLSNASNELGSMCSKHISQLTDIEISNLARFLNTDYDDLVRGINMTITAKGKIVPVYDLEASAGDNVYLEKTGKKIGWINIGDSLRDSESAIYVYGNSMLPGYPSGCLLGLKDNGDNIIEPGNVYVVETKNSQYVKRLYYIKDEETKKTIGFLCVSDNNIKHTEGPLTGEYFYTPFEIPFEEVKKVYKVIGVIKRNTNLMI